MSKGNYNKKIKDLTGQKFGKLTAIKPYKKNKWKNWIWSCKCDCGNFRNVLSSHLQHNVTISCGCINKSKKEFGLATFNQILYIYKKSAKYRNYEWSLTDDEFKTLTQQNCYYCNIEPKNINKSRYNNGDYIYNGIDRINNNLGYFIKNCVTCCGKCNKMKMDLNENDFLEQISKIYLYRKNNGN